MNPWPARAPVPALTEGALHLWSASLDATPERLAGYRSLLNSEELGRAGRFRFARDHDRYVMGRGILRTLLARYAELPDGRAVKLAYGPHGKPSLAAADGLRFNHSHADDFALYAFTRGVEIGVDVERVRDLPDLDATMRASFADAERRHIEALPTPVEQRDAFYRC